MARSNFAILKSKSQQGFTLLEVLLAIGITALIGISSYTLLSQTIRTKESLSSQTERLRQFQLAATMIQNDFRQIGSRVVRDQFGDHLTTLQVGGYNIHGFVEFSRNGISNPLKLKKSNYQRVAYKLDEDKLIRVIWPVLDRAADTEPRTQTLLEGIVSAEVKVWDAEAKVWLSEWPNSDQTSQTPQTKSELPDGISLEIKTETDRVYRWIEQI
ncbi:type II secretion system minor pseudopilin GspJ [Litoribacillus peritrichatus]|uniref:Type II secretion system protein J n=1 Tax=Litoribacillus peritrichatus TaxID=718191 RepID=A0ABP7MCF8_9GAMM